MKHIKALTTCALALAILSTPTFAAPWSQADAYWGAEEMAASRAAVQQKMGGTKHSLIMLDRLERQISDTTQTIVWDAQGWYGGDIDKIWIKSEGAYELGHKTDDAEVQLLWSHALKSFWDIQAGIRLDWEPDTRSHLVVGMQGLAPQWIELDAAAFLSDDGDLAGRVEAEIDLPLNQRLILQPRAELELAGNDSDELGVKAGFTKLNFGARLRYEIIREVAPYIGAEWQRSLGGTAGLVRQSGDPVSDTVITLGLRLWY